MIGTHNAKSKFLTTGLTPSIQKPTKIDTDIIISSNKSLKTSNSTNIIDKNKKDESIKKSLISRRKEYIHSHDGSALRPAQNIAIMGNKSYIVIPKNNAMSVQPAIKPRHSLANKSGYYQDNLLNDLNEKNIIDRKNITTSSSSSQIDKDDLEKNKKIIQDIDDVREQRRSLEPSCDDVAIDGNKKDESMEQDSTIHDDNDSKIIEDKISEEVKENHEINNDKDEMKKNNDIIEKENIKENHKSNEHDTTDNLEKKDKENETNIINKKEEIIPIK